MIGTQLPLSVRLRDSARFDNFVAGDPALLDLLRSPAGDLLLLGAAGTGKSHLLQAAARAAQQRGDVVAYVPLADAAPELLEGTAERDLLAVDELEQLHTGTALRLLRVLDARRRRQRPSLLASRHPPEHLHALPNDLRTRLSQAARFSLMPLDDAARTNLLIQRADDRGLRLPAEVARWLLTQLPRDPASLIAALDALDLASLAAQRRLTIPFVQQALRAVRSPTT